MLLTEGMRIVQIGPEARPGAKQWGVQSLVAIVVWFLDFCFVWGMFAASHGFRHFIV